MKQLVRTELVLKYYDVKEEVTIQCDASKFGLGANLLHHGQPVPYASRALSQPEQRYAQIEKECWQKYLHVSISNNTSMAKTLETIFKKSL